MAANVLSRISCCQHVALEIPSKSGNYQSWPKLKQFILTMNTNFEFYCQATLSNSIFIAPWAPLWINRIYFIGVTFVQNQVISKNVSSEVLPEGNILFANNVAKLHHVKHISSEYLYNNG